MAPTRLGGSARSSRKQSVSEVQRIANRASGSHEHDAARRRSTTLADCAQDLREQGLPLDTLSMGMSGDLEAAVAAGATCVRVGTAIFGERR